MQRTTILALSMLSLGLLPVACTQNFNFFASSEGTGGTSVTSSTGSSSSHSTGTGGSDAGPTCTSGAMACSTPADCGTPANDCVTNTCTGGCCGTADIVMATTCHSGGGNVCDGNGTCVPCLQASDCTATGTVCATATCTANACGQTLASKGTTCTDNGGSVCDGTGKCVNSSCADGIQDGNETDIDCGGSCSPCGDGKMCKMGSDCIDKVCSGAPDKTCQAPTCTDGAQNGNETDVDCGGATCDGQGKTCGIGKGCEVNADCGSGNCQNKVCALLPDGATCGGNNQCANDHCVAGLCCNSACTGTCQACSTVLTGGSNGTCGPISAGKPAPANQCTAATCGNDGKCNGAGACEQVATGTDCAPATCVGSTLTAQGTCGNGTCNAGTTSSCAPYTCGGGNVCRTMCNGSGNGQCTSGNYCNAGACVPQLSPGGPCTTGSQCLSSSCVDGVCCSTACTGTCQACTFALTGVTNGTCASITPGTLAPVGQCAVALPCGNDGNCAAGGVCEQEPAIMACGGTCTDGATTSSETALAMCSGTGTCSGATTSCGAYKCSGTICGTTCTTSAQCVTGKTCTAGVCM